MVINAVGTCATGLTLVVLLVSKLVEGAWVSVLIICVSLVLFERIHRYYDRVVAETERCGPLPADDLPVALPPIVIVPLGRWSRVAQQALRFAVRVSPDVRAVQIVGADVVTENLQERWNELVEVPLRQVGIEPPKLDCVRSGDRRLFAPLLEYITRVRDQHTSREIAVVVPELVERRWYHLLLHTHRASILKTLLLLEGGPRIIIIDAPWHLHD